MLNFIENWGIFWEYRGPLALIIAIGLIIVFSVIMNKVDSWRSTHGRV